MFFISIGAFNIIARVSHTVLLVVAVISGIFMLLAPEIVLLMAGKDYIGAVYLIPTLCTSVFFSYMYLIYSRVELYYEKKLYTVVSTISATILNLLLLLRFSYISAGFASLSSHMLYCLLHNIFYKKVSKQFIDDQKIYSDKFILTLSVALLVFAALVTILYKSFIIRMVLVVTVLLIGVLFKSKIVETVKVMMDK